VPSKIVQRWTWNITNKTRLTQTTKWGKAISRETISDTPIKISDDEKGSRTINKNQGIRKIAR
jgi:hypothetical protein